MCLICESTYDEGDQSAIESKYSGALYGVCPACRRHAEIGRRVEGMPAAGLPQGEIEAARQDGWNKAIRTAKGDTA